MTNEAKILSDPTIAVQMFKRSGRVRIIKMIKEKKKTNLLSTDENILEELIVKFVIEPQLQRKSYAQ